MDRKTQLARLLPGDIFHASCPSSDASLICLAEEVSEDRDAREALFFVGPY
jgi:hypothetical protein